MAILNATHVHPTNVIALSATTRRAKWGILKYIYLVLLKGGNKGVFSLVKVKARAFTHRKI